MSEFAYTKIVIEECAHCEVTQDVTATIDGDELFWNCPDCGAHNDMYWDDSPGFRGWKR